MDFNYDTETITPESTGTITIGGTGALDLPNGTTAERPVGADAGSARYNTDLNRVEVYQDGAWINYTDALYLPGSTFKTIQAFIDIIGSRGTFSGGTFTDNGDGTLAVTGGTGQIHATDNTLSHLYFFDFAAVPSLALTNNALNYIFVDYNGGSPTVIATTTPNFAVDHVIIGQVYRAGTVLTLNNYTRLKLDNSLAGIINRFESVQGFERESGAILSATGTRNFAISAGAFWEGIDRYTLTAKDTSGSDTFTYWYRTAPTTWASAASQTQIDNTQYNDPSSGLVALSNKAYGSHWVYLSTDGQIHVVYGITNSTNLDTTTASQPPTTPPNPLLTASLIGRIIIKKSDADFTEVQSAFNVVFTGGSVTSHNELGGLQGGTTDEYYHTTATQNTLIVNLAALGNGVVVKTAAGTFVNRTLTAGAGISISNGDGVSGNPTISATGGGGTVTSITLTQPAAGLTITGSGTPITSTGTPTFALANDLAALEALASTGIAVRSASDTWVQRSIVSANSKITVANGDGVSGNPTLTIVEANFTGIPESAVTNLVTDLAGKQPLDATLTSLAAFNTNGLLTQTAADTFTGRTLTGPAAGITVTNGNGVAGNPTLALANDLAAVEALAANGMAVRTATDTWTVRTITAGTAISISNGDGIAGNPTITNTGVTSAVAGSNISVSGATGAVTLNVVPAGANTNVQWNNNGVLGGSNNFNFVTGANPYVSVTGTSATNQMRVGPAYTAPGLAAQYLAGPATMYIETGNTDQDAQLVYFNSGVPGTSGYISYAYDGSTPYLRLTDADDDAPYITFNTIGTGTYANPLYVSVFGARGTYAARTAGAASGFSWYVGANTDAGALITANAPIMELDTQFLRIPSGTTAQRPTAVVGMERYNSSIGSPEDYVGGGAWAQRVGVITKSVIPTTLTNAAGNVLSYSVPGGTLGTTNLLHIRTCGTFARTTGSARSVTITVSYGGTTLWSDTTANQAGNSDGAWDLDLILASNNSANAQILNGTVRIGGTGNVTVGTAGDLNTASINAFAIVNGTAAVNSGAAQTLTIAVSFSGTGTTWVTNFHIIEKM